MSSAVLDASALLALLCKEEGAEFVAKHSQGALISTVNVAEVYSKQKDANVTEAQIDWAISALQLVPVPFDIPHAKLVGSLRESTRSLGISLGDRACIALGIHRKLPVITSEKKWETLNLNVEVRLLR